ncbi:MAG: amidohydrolase family protein [Planctomycetota bacterium]|jgi:N-acyl-D-amino-acid deacylase|nr:amidohydrolase family protein [Planctomycetota bacterium]MDP7129021.1 amidohydrolase family protein [Planctomycetota bacterium]MDP7249460.1 amidohydrolase family protein [Planctomycetota bacterium]
MNFDFIFENAKVVDGTGCAWFLADVGVAGDRIKAIGKLDAATAARRIAAAGKVLCPGFIDVHVHSEIALLTGEAALPRLTQGVTADVLGPDGMGYAPLSSERLEETKEYLSIFYGIPDVGWEWRTYGEYLEQFHEKCALNVIPQVAYNAIRAEAVGWDGRPATEAELEHMKDLTRQVMEDGATGIQTGLEYYPSAHGTTEELIELCKVVREYGGVHSSHIRGYGVHFENSCNEVFRISEEAEIPFHFSHLFGLPEFYKPLEDARARGIDVTFDAYPYMAGSTHLVYCFPKWVQTGTPDEVLQRLGDPDERERYRPQMNQFFEDRAYDTQDVVFSTVGDGDHEILGKSLSDAVAESGKDLTDFASDLLVEQNLQVLMIFHWQDEDKQKTALTHPYHMVCSDGIFKAGRPHPRGYGTFPRFIALTAKQKGWLTLEDAIRRMTSFPATRYGLADRGIIREGMAADIVIFDEDDLIDTATYEDGKQLCQGIEYVLVNGKLALEKGEVVNGTAGRVVGRS